MEALLGFHLPTQQIMMRRPSLARYGKIMSSSSLYTLLAGSPHSTRGGHSVHGDPSARVLYSVAIRVPNDHEHAQANKFKSVVELKNMVA